MARGDRNPYAVPSFYLRKALPGCVHGLGPCGLGSNPSMETKFIGGLAQLGERLHGMQKANGSIPLSSTKF